MDLVNKISKKYEFDKWYDVPKDNSLSFAIKQIDRDDMKILVVIDKKGEGSRQVKTVKMSEENFYNFLYQPELFDLFGEK